ncbi:MAG: hypothetical protein AAFY74_13940 [Pseudomonadota bacterium]
MASKAFLVTAFLGLGLLKACGPAAASQQQAQREHEIACISGTLAGALIGGAIGSGRGQDILTAAGAKAGASAGRSYSCG